MNINFREEVANLEIWKKTIDKAIDSDDEDIKDCYYQQIMPFREKEVSVAAGVISIAFPGETVVPGTAFTSVERITDGDMTRVKTRKTPDFSFNEEKYTEWFNETFDEKVSGLEVAKKIISEFGHKEKP